MESTRLKLPLSKVTSENFLSALRILGSEKLPLKVSYRLGRAIRCVNGFIDDFHKAKLLSIQRHGAEEVLKMKCGTDGCGNDLTGPKSYDVICEKCSQITTAPAFGHTFWRIPPNDHNALTAFQQEIEEASKEEVEIFLDQKIKIEDLDGIKLPPLAAMELLEIIEEPV